MQFDHDIAVFSIQFIITLHQRLGIPIQPAFSQFLLLLLFLVVVVIESHRVFLIYHNGGIRRRSIYLCSFPYMKKIDQSIINVTFHILYMYF
jgi:hypothetical protein